MSTLNEKQYGVLATRRQGFDTMLWQTPVLSLTAQAFLFTIALGSGIRPTARFISAMLALIAALASIQLMSKHRYNETEDMRVLEEYEKNEKFMPIHARRPGSHLPNTWSSYKVWRAVLYAFAVAAAAVLIDVVCKRGWMT